jgi:hypothetical protein
MRPVGGNTSVKAITRPATRFGAVEVHMFPNARPAGRVAWPSPALGSLIRVALGIATVPIGSNYEAKRLERDFTIYLLALIAPCRSLIFQPFSLEQTLVIQLLS